MVHWKETKKGIAIPISVIGAIAFIIVVMLLIPVLFFNSGHDSGNYYKSIFIEPVLGMTLGYLVYSMIQSMEVMFALKCLICVWH